MKIGVSGPSKSKGKDIIKKVVGLHEVGNVLDVYCPNRGKCTWSK